MQVYKVRVLLLIVQDTVLLITVEDDLLKSEMSGASALHIILKYNPGSL